MTPAEVIGLAILLALVLAGLLEQRSERLRNQGAYTPRIRRELARERKRANPTFAFGRVWRF